MTEHLVQAFAFDIHIRQTASDPLPDKGVEIDAKEVGQGETYNDGSTQVSAFLVDHGTVKPAFGYRVDSAGHSVVISGDTKFCQNLADFARGADCLTCCLEPCLEELHAAFETFDWVCRRCGTGLRDSETEAGCRLSL